MSRDEPAAASTILLESHVSPASIVPPKFFAFAVSIISVAYSTEVGAKMTDAPKLTALSIYEEKSEVPFGKFSYL